MRGYSVIDNGNWSQHLNRVMFQRARRMNYEIANSPHAPCKLVAGCTEIRHTATSNPLNMPGG